jgi:hypothetical protein
VRINKHDAERFARHHVEPPDAIDHIMAAFKSVADCVVGVWSFAWGCGTNTCDSSDGNASDAGSDYSEMPKMQACDMPLHGLNAFDADLFYQAPVQQLLFSTRHRACFSCPHNGHCQHPVKVDMTDGQVASLCHLFGRQDRRRHHRVHVEPLTLFVSGQFILFVVGLMLWMSLQAVNAMDAADDGTRTATKIPLFSGKKAEFAMWIMKLMAVATIGNYGLALHRNVAANGTVTYGEPVCPAD